MKRYIYAGALLLTLMLAVTAAGCVNITTGTVIVLSDPGVTVDGSPVSESTRAAVYAGADIVYYEDGQDSSYGQGTDADAHSKEEAARHTVITITEPGTYRVSGTLSAGQIVVDLGYYAEIDTHAAVEIILDGVNITCGVAPAILFKNVYETESTTAAGAVLTIADGSVNYINGSYVARIYEENSNETLYKYDGAISSEVTLLIQGEASGTGILTVNGELEGISTKMHLTINGGNLYVYADDDAVNANEDGVSVVTMNGGYLYAKGNLGREGDGVDSNGDIILTGGMIAAYGGGSDTEGGLDPDGVILISGGSFVSFGTGTVSSESTQPYMKLQFAGMQQAGSKILITTTSGVEVMQYTTGMTYSAVALTADMFEFGESYYVYVDGVRQVYTGVAAGTGMGMQQGGGGVPDDGGTMIKGDRPDMGQMPDMQNMTVPDMQNMTRPDMQNMTVPDMGQMTGGFGGGFGSGGTQTTSVDATAVFTLTAASQMFSGVTNEG